MTYTAAPRNIIFGHYANREPTFVAVCRVREGGRYRQVQLLLKSEEVNFKVAIISKEVVIIERSP